MAKRPTAKIVAERAGVSKWTVIRAFIPGASISESSRKKVVRAAEVLNYTPNFLARSLATSFTHQVAVFVDDFTNPQKLPFLEQLTLKLQTEGLVAVLININLNFDHVQALLNAEQRQVDAIVLFNDRKIEKVQEKVSELQRRILIRSRVNISGDLDLEAIRRRTRL